MGEGTEAFVKRRNERTARHAPQKITNLAQEGKKKCNIYGGAAAAQLLRQLQ